MVLTRLIVLAGLMSGAGLLDSPAWARCPNACRASLSATNRTCRAACIPAGPGRECRSSCTAERQAEKATCRAAVTPTPPGCGLADLYVAAFGALNGGGSVSSPYRRITDAVARARAERAFGALPPEDEIRIHVAPGTYVGSYDPAQLQGHAEYEVLPIILNVPRLAVLGSTVLVRDDRGLPTASDSASEAILEPDTPLIPSQSLCLVTRTADGAVGNRSTFDGFVLDGRMTAVADQTAGVFVDRVSDFRISNNIIRRTSFGVTTRLASGTIEGNLLTGQVEAGASVTGGSLAQPATVLVHANRAAANGLHGLMGFADAPVTIIPLDLGSNTLELAPLQTTFDRSDPEDLQNIPDRLVVTLSENDISNNGSIGIRLAAFLPYSYQTKDGTQPVTAVLTASVLGNTCTGNGAYGVAMEAAFPFRDNVRRFVLTFAGTFEGNSFTESGRAAALFDFTRWDVSLGMNSFQTYKFAEESTYAVTDSDGELAGFDYDNPVMDPLSGIVLNNTLTVNGVEVPHGKSITPVH